MIVIIIGLPGTGKTTFSKALAQEIGAIHLNTDILRDELDLRGQYDRNTKLLIYELLQAKVAQAINAKKDIIVDGTFYKKILRDDYFELAHKNQVPIYWIELKATEDCIRSRVAKKRIYSEADFQVYLKVKAKFEPMEEDHLQVWNNNSSSMEDCLLEALQYLESNQNHG